ncbi:MAG: hypothetical protein C0622_01880, partial [Desulfuromonas sp.]
MADQVVLPAGIRRHRNKAFIRQTEGFELSLLDDCDNAYRLTAAVSAGKVPTLIEEFARFLQGDAFFILEFYPNDPLLSRPSGLAERPVPTVYYSPYLATDYILQTIAPYLERMIHDGFVGFGLANNRRGLEFF